MKILFLLTSMLLFAEMQTIYAQKKIHLPNPNPPDTSIKAEPLRTVSGLMTGNQIAIRRTDWINDGTPLLTFKITSARITAGKLEFIGVGEKSQRLTAQLISTNARSANPWPSAASETAKNRKSTDQNRAEPGTAEKNEQTQSLYSSAESGSGCELLFLKMQFPAQSTPVQVGVVLAHQDNPRGNEINQAVCRIVRNLAANQKTGEQVSKLNQILKK